MESSCHKYVYIKLFLKAEQQQIKWSLSKIVSRISTVLQSEWKSFIRNLLKYHRSEIYCEELSLKKH